MKGVVPENTQIDNGPLLDEVVISPRIKNAFHARIVPARFSLCSLSQLLLVSF